MVFDELMTWYKETLESLEYSKKVLKGNFEKQNYEPLMKNTVQVQCLEDELQRIKKIIQNNFLSLIRFIKEIIKLWEHYSLYYLLLVFYYL